MFGLFDKKKEAEVSLADRIAAKPLAAAGAPQGATAAKPRVPFAGLGSVGAGDMKSAYLSRSELPAERLRDLTMCRAALRSCSASSRPISPWRRLRARYRRHRLPMFRSCSSPRAGS